MRKYDIYLCWVPFQDGGKNRPVLILDNNTAVTIGAEVTSHSPRVYDNGDYPIEDWQEANLRKPSTVRLSRQLQVNESNLRHYIGHLSDFDIENIEIMLRNIFDIGN